jgi:hypothetical protein
MLKLIYAQTPATPPTGYPPYLNVSGIVGDPENDGIRVIVRDEAHLEHTENGAYYAAGHTSTVVITREQALDLADSIREHYGEEDSVLAIKNLSNGLTLGQAENASNEVPMPVGVVEAAQFDGRNVPSPVGASGPLGHRKTAALNHDEHCGAGDHGFDVVSEQPEKLVFTPLGGRDPGDENPS